MAVCKECQEGKHKHMDAMRDPGFDKMPRHMQLDGVDCKNLIGEYDQCVCPETVRFHRKSMLPPACLTCSELDQTEFTCKACTPLSEKASLCPKGKQLY